MEQVKGSFLRYVLSRVHKKNKDFTMIVVGETGSGKSYSVLKLGESLDPTFNIDRVCFKSAEFMKLVRTITKPENKGKYVGKVIVWDELGVEQGARNFMSIKNKVMNYFFQTCRSLNLILFMTVPYKSLVDVATRKLAHATGEMKGIDRTEGLSTMKVVFHQTNSTTEKIYSKFLRVKGEGGGWKVIKKIKLGLPSPELLDLYEKKKTNYQNSLYSSIEKELNKEDEEKVEEKVIKKPLTPLQEEILKLWDGGKTTNTEIAKKLGIFPTVLSKSLGFMKRKGYEKELERTSLGRRKKDKRKIDNNKYNIVFKKEPSHLLNENRGEEIQKIFQK